MQRRDFIKSLTIASVAAGLGAEAQTTAQTTPARSAVKRPESPDMPYRTLGRTGERVSAIGLGGAHIGFGSEPDSIALMRRASDSGITFFDNSWDYGDGRSEERMGKALRDGYRQKVFLMTKTDSHSAAGWNKQLETSLTRLQTDYLDLYQMHHIDRNARWEEVWQAFDLLIAQGKVLYVGSSNFAGWHIAQAQESAKARLGVGLVSEQSVYNLTKRTLELEVIPAASAYGMAFLAYSPLGGGLLGGKPADNDGGRRNFMTLSEKVAAFGTFCEELGHSAAAVALAWVAQAPGVTAPVIGPRTMAQLQSALAALELRLDEATLKRLDELFPGPGGPAPEAYAW
jgi:aryl-alcohol dehydrogenase-like predicted oxidoreductase